LSKSSKVIGFFASTGLGASVVGATRGITFGAVGVIFVGAGVGVGREVGRGVGTALDAGIGVVFVVTGLTGTETDGKEEGGP
jgi:hypothetical protein